MLKPPIHQYEIKFSPFTDKNVFCVLALLRYEVLIGGYNLM